MSQKISLPVVLVVDDEPLVRMYAVDMLEDAGFRVIEANDGDEALALILDHGEITVLFTDIHMPGKFDGLELARKVHERRPDIQLILTSGRARPDRNELPHDGAFIPKPYDASVIVRMIKASQGREG